MSIRFHLETESPAQTQLPPDPALHLSPQTTQTGLAQSPCAWGVARLILEKGPVRLHPLPPLGRLPRKWWAGEADLL